MKPIDVFKIGSLSVHLVPDDITNIPSDVIVSSDDTDLTMSGGVSRRILEVAGSDMRQEALMKNPGSVGEVIVSSSGSLNCKNIFHALVVDYSTGEFPEYELVMSLTQTCLDLANQMGHTSIAIPPMAAGAGRLDPTISAEAIIEGISRWSSGSLINIKNVYIATLNVQQETLKSFLKTLVDRTVRNSYEKRLLDKQAELDKLEEKRHYQQVYDEHMIEHLKEELAKPSKHHIPHPIAFTRSKADIGITALERAWNLCNCVEAIVRFVVSVMISIAKEYNLTDKIETEIFKRPLTFGKWVELMREYSLILHNHNNLDNLLFSNIASYYCDSNGKPNKTGKFIDSTVTLRNKMGHPIGGVLPDELRCKGFEKELRLGIDDVIGSLTESLPYKLSVVRSIGAFGSDGNIKYTVSILHGDSSLFNNENIECREKLNPGTVGIWSNQSRKFLQLHPFITYKKCPTCQLENVFFLDEIRSDSKGRWWNYTDGHMIQEELT